MFIAHCLWQASQGPANDTAVIEVDTSQPSEVEDNMEEKHGLISQQQEAEATSEGRPPSVSRARFVASSLNPMHFDLVRFMCAYACGLMHSMPANSCGFSCLCTYSH